ncbi:Glycosyltransferase [Halomicronema hongdechloris C2206]|uniref:Glycosyltransferase n=1 Tax=Halomicronema hongdechloris C2206 TaxID=1641165 RepID=A0A1Z3HH71_9CYAN|nr:Glycosyltransferase [Halomicronema hongdechloris C2206]
MTRVYLVSHLLKQLGHRVNVIGCQFGDDIYPQPPADLSVQAIAGRPLPGALRSLQQLLVRTRGDIVYAIKPRLSSLFPALLSKWFRRTPVLLDIDDWELSWLGGDKTPYQPTLKQLLRDILKSDGALRQLDHRFYLEWMESLVPQADGITVNTRFLQRRFGGYYLPNGRDTDLFDPDRFDAETCRQRYGLAGYRVLMFPGTVRPHKGIEDVLQALDHLNQADIRLVIVGGRRPDSYEEDLSKRWSRWLIKLPRFPIERMPEVVAAAHIVVVPQRDTLTAQAQFPLKLTDGMAMAKPILSTRVGDIPEILDGAGYLVTPGAPDQIAQALRWLLTHPKQAVEQGKRARQRCLQQYSYHAMAQTLAQVIAKTVQRTLPSHCQPSVCRPPE